MQVIRGKREMRQWTRDHRAKGRSVALVPTMGNLHMGHLSLVEEAKRQCDVVVTSIYVNPTQFGPDEDFEQYPRTLQSDSQKLTSVGCDAIFHPQTLYEDFGGQPAHETWVDVVNLTQSLCGATRPGHFRGVATIVSKLFLIVEPDVAVFGDKDYQQRRVIDRMVRDLDFGVRIIACATARATDGLALSSRNSRLTIEDRARAVALPQALLWAAAQVKKGDRDSAAIVAEVKRRCRQANGKIDYVEIVDDATLLPVKPDVPLSQAAVIAAAVFWGTVRLIDNQRLVL